LDYTLFIPSDTSHHLCSCLHKIGGGSFAQEMVANW